MTERLKASPLFGILWEEYLLCRTVQYVTLRVPAKLGGSKGNESIVTFLFPTHIHCWPNGGCLHEQSYLTVRIFAAFLAGEQYGASREPKRQA